VPLSQPELEAEVRRLGPFHHGVDLPHGVSTQSRETIRGKGEFNRMRDLQVGAWPTIVEHFGGSLAGQRVLDVGCNCGGFSVRAARDGAEYVLGVDVVDRYIEQAGFIKRALELDALDFRVLGIEDIDRDQLGSFDVTLFFGLLFHLENPVPAMRRLASVTDRMMVVDTNIDKGRRPLWRMKVVGAPNPDNPSTSLWRPEEGAIQLMPTQSALERLLNFLGFATVTRLEPHPDQARRYHNGTRATFVALRAD
jgi:tRNA (mo5U34)-methyltransferase